MYWRMCGLINLNFKSPDGRRILSSIGRTEFPDRRLSSCRTVSSGMTMLTLFSNVFLTSVTVNAPLQVTDAAKSTSFMRKLLPAASRHFVLVHHVLIHYINDRLKRAPKIANFY